MSNILEQISYSLLIKEINNTEELLIIDRLLDLDLPLSEFNFSEAKKNSPQYLNYIENEGEVFEILMVDQVLFNAQSALIKKILDQELAVCIYIPQTRTSFIIKNNFVSGYPDIIYQFPSNITVSLVDMLEMGA
jgi:hypothetical protein